MIFSDLPEAVWCEWHVLCALLLMLFGGRIYIICVRTCVVLFRENYLLKQGGEPGQPLISEIKLYYTIKNSKFYKFPPPPPKKNDPSSISPYNFKQNPQPLFIGTNKLPIYIFIIGMTSHYYLFLQEYTPLPESVHYQNVNSPCLNSWNDVQFSWYIFFNKSPAHTYLKNVRHLL